MSLISRLLSDFKAAHKHRKDLGAELSALAALQPPAKAFLELVSSSRRALEPSYLEYVASVSTPEWALSLETASVMHALCKARRPKAVLDLGSGFSSFTLRHYAQSAGHECVVHSVDDAAAWLDRTRQYLGSKGLPTTGLMMLSELGSLPPGSQDLVLHDMGDITTRVQTLASMISKRSESGWILLDDVHFQPYGTLASDECVSAGLAVLPLPELTRDSFGRYACLAGRP